MYSQKENRCRSSIDGDEIVIIILYYLYGIRLYKYIYIYITLRTCITILYYITFADAAVRSQVRSAEICISHDDSRHTYVTHTHTHLTDIYIYRSHNIIL